MPHSYGIRARTRHMFARNFREHGMPIKLTTYLKTYKVGDIVDIKANGAIHKGMPHKFYHGYVSRSLCLLASTTTTSNNSTSFQFQQQTDLALLDELVDRNSL
ncbi:hypothetical protein BGZ80_007396, partial [Entomortierella chlamydospora]